MADMGTLLQAMYDKLYSLSGSVPYATLLDHHDFSAGEVKYPLVAMDFGRRRRTPDGMSWLYDIEILTCASVDRDGATPIKTARLVVDEIVEKTDAALIHVQGWPAPDSIETEFGYTEDGSVILYFGLTKITTNWAR